MYISEIIKSIIGFDWSTDTFIVAGMVSAFTVLAAILIKLFEKEFTKPIAYLGLMLLPVGFFAILIVGVSLNDVVKSPAQNNVERNVTVSGMGIIKRKHLDTGDTIYTVDSKSVGGFKLGKPGKYPTYFICPKYKQTKSVTVNELYLTDKQAKEIEKHNVGEKVYVKLSGTGEVLEVRLIN